MDYTEVIIDQRFHRHLIGKNGANSEYNYCENQTITFIQKVSCKWPLVVVEYSQALFLLRYTLRESGQLLFWRLFYFIETLNNLVYDSRGKVSGRI